MALTNIYMHIPTPSFQNYTRLNSTNFNEYVCNHSNVPFLLIQVHKKNKQIQVVTRHTHAAGLGVYCTGISVY